MCPPMRQPKRSSKWFLKLLAAFSSLSTGWIPRNLFQQIFVASRAPESASVWIQKTLSWALLEDSIWVKGLTGFYRPYKKFGGTTSRAYETFGCRGRPFRGLIILYK